MVNHKNITFLKNKKDILIYLIKIHHKNSKNKISLNSKDIKMKCHAKRTVYKIKPKKQINK